MTATYQAPVQARASQSALWSVFRDRMLSLISAVSVRSQATTQSDMEWHKLNDHLLRDIGKSRGEAEVARDRE